MHDTTALKVKFNSYFDGNTKNTIKFIFAIQRYQDVSRFVNPNSLFTAVYNNVADKLKQDSHHIKQRHYTHNNKH